MSNEDNIAWTIIQTLSDIQISIEYINAYSHTSCKEIAVNIITI